MRRRRKKLVKVKGCNETAGDGVTFTERLRGGRLSLPFFPSFPVVCLEPPHFNPERTRRIDQIRIEEASMVIVKCSAVQ